MQKLESYAHKEVQQDKKVSIREETRLKRNEVKKSNARAEAIREMKIFDTKLNSYLRKRCKLVNTAVSIYIHNSFKNYAASNDRYYILEKDREVLLQIENNSEYIDGTFIELLKTTNFGRNLSLLDNKTVSGLSFPSISLRSINTEQHSQQMIGCFTDLSHVKKVISEKQIKKPVEYPKKTPLEKRHNFKKNMPKQQQIGKYDDLLALSLELQDQPISERLADEESSSLNLEGNPRLAVVELQNNEVQNNGDFRQTASFYGTGDMNGHIMIP